MIGHRGDFISEQDDAKTADSIPVVVLSSGKQVDNRTERYHARQSMTCDSCGHKQLFNGIEDSICEKCEEKRFTMKSNWRQDLLEDACVLIIGCGAVGNEVAKNLALLGVKHYVLMDFDTISESNRSRCVFFNESIINDLGWPEKEVYKVDAVKKGIESILTDAKVTTILGGPADGLSRAKRSAWLNIPRPDGGLAGIFRNEFIDIISDCDVCVVATDGISAEETINKWLYPLIPLVRGAMMAGNPSNIEVKTSLPCTTACLMCHHVETGLESKMENGESNWILLREQTGGKCGEVAEAMNARSFGHANSLVGAVISGQIVSILMGWRSYLDSGRKTWPRWIPPPLWSQSISLTVDAPWMHIMRNLDDIERLEPTEFHDPRCYHCNMWSEDPPFNSPDGPPETILPDWVGGDSWLVNPRDEISSFSLRRGN